MIFINNFLNSAAKIQSYYNNYKFCHAYFVMFAKSEN